MLVLQITAILQLVEMGHGVDIVTVTDYLSKKKELDSVGGLPYLASLSEGLPRKLSIESYVRIVRDKSLMRQLLTVCDMGMIEASDQSREALDVLNQVTSRLTEISARDLILFSRRSISSRTSSWLASAFS